MLLKISIRASTSHVNIKQSAGRSPHLMPVVFAKKTVLHTRSPYVLLTQLHSKTSAFMYWMFAGSKVIIPYIILEAAQVRIHLKGGITHSVEKNGIVSNL